jgi:hypothetical protein
MVDALTALSYPVCRQRYRGVASWIECKAARRAGLEDEMKPELCEHSPQSGTLYTTTGLPASTSRRDDFPIEAMCAKCSRPIRRPRGDDPVWEPKYPTTAERLVSFTGRHPEVSANESGRASWFADDGSHTRTFDSLEKMLDYLEARFDRSPDVETSTRWGAVLDRFDDR